MSIIAIDCGASFIKASRIENGDVVEYRVEKTPADDSIDKLDLSINIIKDLIDKLSNDTEVHLGFSNEMHGFVLADKNGNPVTKYISWQCEYAGNIYKNGLTYLEHLEKKLPIEEIRTTGMPLKLGLPVSNLYYVVNTDLLVSGEEYYFYTLGDYYIRVLSGKEPYMHITNAAGTGLYDIANKCWNRKIIELICPREKNYKIIFPEIYENQPSICGKIFGKRTVFYPALGDQQAALLGAGVREPGDVSFNFGTGAQISLVSNIFEQSDNYQTRPFFNGLYLKTIPHIPSGRALNVYFNFVKEIITDYREISDDEIWNYINKKVEENDKQHMMIDMSFFTNAITSKTKGEIREIEEKGFSVGNLFESIYEQMAYNIQVVCKKLGIKALDRVIISGGILSKNKVLREIVLNSFPNKVEPILAENETARGIGLFVERNMNESKSI